MDSNRAKAIAEEINAHWVRVLIPMSGYRGTIDLIYTYGTKRLIVRGDSMITHGNGTFRFDGDDPRRKMECLFGISSADSNQTRSPE